jgi:hypothetical protein
MLRDQQGGAGAQRRKRDADAISGCAESDLLLHNPIPEDLLTLP